MSCLARLLVEVRVLDLEHVLHFFFVVLVTMYLITLILANLIVIILVLNHMVQLAFKLLDLPHVLPDDII